MDLIILAYFLGVLSWISVVLSIVCCVILYFTMQNLIRSDNINSRELDAKEDDFIINAICIFVCCLPLIFVICFLGLGAYIALSVRSF